MSGQSRNALLLIALLVPVEAFAQSQGSNNDSGIRIGLDAPNLDNFGGGQRGSNWTSQPSNARFGGSSARPARGRPARGTGAGISLDQFDAQPSRDANENLQRDRFSTGGQRPDSEPLAQIPDRLRDPLRSVLMSDDQESAAAQTSDAWSLGPGSNFDTGRRQPSPDTTDSRGRGASSGTLYGFGDDGESMYGAPSRRRGASQTSPLDRTGRGRRSNGPLFETTHEAAILDNPPRYPRSRESMQANQSLEGEQPSSATELLNRLGRPNSRRDSTALDNADSQDPLLQNESEDGTDTDIAGVAGSTTGVEQIVTPFWLTMGFFTSLAANVYFCWVAWGIHNRYQDLVDDVSESDNRLQRQSRRLREKDSYRSRGEESELLRGAVDA